MLWRLTGMCAAAILIACDASAPTTPRDDVAELEHRTMASQSAARVSGIAAGGGQAELPPGFSPLSFTFAAIAREDGSATGVFSFRWESASGTTDFDAAVTCVTFDATNQRAWIGGVVTRNNSTNPAVRTGIHEVGDDIWFRVVDYGEGANAAPDRTTVVGFAGAAGIITSAEYCAVRPWPDGDARTWPVTRGNIQVMP